MPMPHRRRTTPGKGPFAATRKPAATTLRRSATAMKEAIQVATMAVRYFIDMGVQRRVAEMNTANRKGAEAMTAANVRRLLDDVQKGGEVRIQTINQADGPYCIVAGLGVHAGGYPTVDEAIAAWLDARDFDRDRRAAS